MPTAGLWPTTFLVVAAACQAVPPAASFESPAGIVRADLAERAQEVALLFEQLRPLILEQLPDSDCRANEVWVQETPTLYRFSETAYEEADGFWSESHGRIHLREDAQSLARTLAHELVHSSLGDSWDVLPGTIEEGLCDVVSVLVCPVDSGSMRTGRLSAAAFATGGLELEIELFLPGQASRSGVQIGAMTRMRLQGEVRDGFDPADVFTIPAGLSTTHLPTNDKKALYGLSYLVVDRIVDRIGFVGLHQICLRARAADLKEVPADWLLEAAGIPQHGRHAWRTALQESLGPQDLQTLVDLYPGLLLDTAARVFGAGSRVRIDRAGVSPITACIRVRGTETRLDVRLEIEGESLAHFEPRDLPESSDLEE